MNKFRVFDRESNQYLPCFLIDENRVVVHPKVIDPIIEQDLVVTDKDGTHIYEGDLLKIKMRLNDEYTSEGYYKVAFTKYFNIMLLFIKLCHSDKIGEHINQNPLTNTLSYENGGLKISEGRLVIRNEYYTSRVNSLLFESDDIKIVGNVNEQL